VEWWRELNWPVDEEEIADLAHPHKRRGIVREFSRHKETTRRFCSDLMVASFGRASIRKPYKPPRAVAPLRKLPSFNTTSMMRVSFLDSDTCAGLATART
jgi:hypothetical protein